MMDGPCQMRLLASREGVAAEIVSRLVVLRQLAVPQTWNDRHRLLAHVGPPTKPESRTSVQPCAACQRGCIVILSTCGAPVISYLTLTDGWDNLLKHSDTSSSNIELGQIESWSLEHPVLVVPNPMRPTCACADASAYLDSLMPSTSESPESWVGRVKEIAPPATSVVLPERYILLAGARGPTDDAADAVQKR